MKIHLTLSAGLTKGFLGYPQFSLGGRSELRKEGIATLGVAPRMRQLEKSTASRV